MSGSAIASSLAAWCIKIYPPCKLVVVKNKLPRSMSRGNASLQAKKVTSFTLSAVQCDSETILWLYIQDIYITL